jgi:uncharacterized protein
MADWSKILSRGDVEDRRAMGPAGIGGGIGIVGIVIVLAINILGGGNVSPGTVTDILNQFQQAQGVQKQSGDASQFAGSDQYETFASTVLGSNNEAWRKVFEQSGKTYNEPKLVLFRGSTGSGCGGADAAVGPHYCPADGTIYLDETFFDELQKLGTAGGDVAEAYVIAHEVGHHVQNELGIMDSLDRSNEQSIKLELQADCFAGVWANSISDLGIFGNNEINEAVDAAAAVGDDRIQKTTQGRVNPEAWTHGSSQQRVDWFNTGYTTGRPASCNTFKS